MGLERAARTSLLTSGRPMRPCHKCTLMVLLECFKVQPSSMFANKFCQASAFLGAAHSRPHASHGWSCSSCVTIAAWWMSSRSKARPGRFPASLIRQSRTSAQSSLLISVQTSPAAPKVGPGSAPCSGPDHQTAPSAASKSTNKLQNFSQIENIKRRTDT